MTKVEIDDRIAKMLKDGAVEGITEEEQDAAIELFNAMDELCAGKSNEMVIKVITNLLARAMLYGSGGHRPMMETIAGKFALHLKACIEHFEEIEREGHEPTLK